MLSCHLGPRVVHENSCVSTVKPWRVSMYQKICITGLTSSLGISNEARYDLLFILLPCPLLLLLHLLLLICSFVNSKSCNTISTKDLDWIVCCCLSVLFCFWNIGMCLLRVTGNGQCWKGIVRKNCVCVGWWCKNRQQWMRPMCSIIWHMRAQWTLILCQTLQWKQLYWPRSITLDKHPVNYSSSHIPSESGSKNCL